MVWHLGFSAGKEFVNNALEKIINETKDDVDKLAKVAAPISIPVDITRSVFRFGLYNLFFVIGMIAAGIEAMQNGDVKKAFSKWIDKQIDKQAGKITEGLEHIAETGKSIFSKFLPWNLFSAKKKSPKSKDNTGNGPDAGSETEAEDEDKDKDDPTKVQDNSDPNAVREGENAAGGLDPITGEDPNSTIQNPENCGSLTDRNRGR